MKDIKRDDEQIDEIIKKYEEFLNHEQLLADLVEKWGPILDGEPDK